MRGWIGVDLDGTLAHYDKWVGAHHIGEPISAMVERVKYWIANGHTVKIFTARICDGKAETIEVIKKWCKEHIGTELEVTNVKDFGMVALWDDRAVQVVPNKGIALQDTLMEYLYKTGKLDKEELSQEIDAKGWNQ